MFDVANQSFCFKDEEGSCTLAWYLKYMHVYIALERRHTFLFQRIFKIII